LGKRGESKVRVVSERRKSATPFPWAHCLDGQCESPQESSGTRIVGGEEWRDTSTLREGIPDDEKKKSITHMNGTKGGSVSHF